MAELKTGYTERAMLARFWGWMRPYRRKVFWSMALIPVVAACAVAQPRILGVAIDQFMLKGDLDGLGQAALAFLAVIVLEYIAGASQMYLLTVAGVRAVGDIRQDIYTHVMGQGRWFFDRRPTGALLARTTTDVEALGESFITGVVGILGDAAKLIGIVGYMLSLDWQLTLMAFSVLPIIVLVVNLFRKKLRHYSVEVRRLVASINGFMQEHLAGVEVVQLEGRQDQATAEFSRVNREALKTYHWSNFYDAGLYAVMDGMSSICIGVVLWFGGAQVLSGSLTPGMLVAFVEYVQKALVPIKEFSGKYATLQRSFAALERIFGLLDHREMVGAGTERLVNPTGRVTYKDVAFTYPSTDAQVLRGIDLDVKPGSVVAIVGSTGAGQSTVTRLLTRAYDGYTGSIQIDGVEVRDVDPGDLRAAVAVVHQDVYLFRGSVAFNLSMGDESITRERMMEAAELVQARGFIEALPEGLDTDVGERGGRLSAGQAQLISFARAMCRDPAVVVLDEATASVDPATEVMIQSAIERILAVKTVIVVAHRLSTIRAADEILVLEGGKIVERGTHDELLTLAGRYSQLHEHQLTVAG